jgi:hypothetical protein
VVDFNQKVRPSGDPSYLTASKEPSRNDFRNESLGTLFDGIGTLVSQGAKVGYEHVNRNIQEDIWNSVDHRLDQQGVGTATDIAAADTSRGRPSPPALNDLSSRMQRLKAAVEAGAITNTDFEARLAADARAIRSKYPGFREEVDNMMKSVAGIDPANSLRRSLLSDLLRGQSEAQAQKDAEDKWVDQNAQYLPSNYWQLKAQGRAPSFLELRAHVAGEKQFVHGLEKDRLSISHSLDTSNFSADRAERVASPMVTEVISKSVNELYTSEVITQLQEFARKGEPIPPELQAQALVALGQLEATANMTVDKLLRETQGQNGNTLYGVMGSERADKLKKSALAPLTTMREYIAGNKTGFLALNGEMIEARKTAGVRELLDKVPFANTLVKLGALGPGGQVFVQTQLTNTGSPLLSEGVQAVQKIISLDAATGTGMTNTAATRAAQEAETRNPDLKGATAAVIQSKVSTITNTSLDPTIRANTARTMFNSGEVHFLQKMPKAKQTDFLTQMASPEMSKQIRAMNDPKLWQDYKNWTVNSFVNVFRNELRDVKDSVNREWYDVVYNPESNQFDVVPTAAGIKATKEQGSVGNPLNAIEGMFNSNLQTQVEKVNRGIKVIEPVLKVDGMDVGKEMGKLLRNAQLMPGAKEDSFFGMMRRAWDRALTPMTQEDRDAENPLTFGGTKPNFTKPQGDNSGANRTLSNYLQSGVDQLHPSTMKMFNGLKDAGVISDANLRSAFRSPGANARAGGAKGSKHVEGKAIDVDVRDMSDEQKTALLEAAIENGATGIGIYPGGRSLHLDTRDIPVTWGSNPAGSYKGVPWQDQPKWAQGPLRKLFERAEGVNAIQQATRGK